MAKVEFDEAPYSWIKNMSSLDGDPNRDELDDFVRAFELVYLRTGQAEIAEFLPARDHSLYATVLCELIRIDLEFGWERGRPKTLSEYLRAFPELEHDREGLRAIVFEENRLHRQAEERTSPDGSRRREAVISVEGERRVATGGRPRATCPEAFQ